jgi:hypothetical protein
MLRDADGHLAQAHVVLVQPPVYRNFFSTGAGNASREMLEREQDATGVTAEPAGMFAAAVGWGLHQLARDTVPTCWSSAPPAAGRSRASASAPRTYEMLPPARGLTVCAAGERRTLTAKSCTALRHVSGAAGTRPQGRARTTTVSIRHPE